MAKAAKKKSATKAKARPAKPGKSKAKTKARAAKPSRSKAKTSREKAASLKEYNRKRDFSKTAEPAGEPVYAKKGQRLAFVVQKHEASHLHYDLRLEVNGVMKSWSVPKGPSFDPKVKRLAVQVEDHPVSYNSFEGTIPQGEYGGGTVMIWDYGTYTVDDAQDDPEALMLEGLEKGKLAFTFQGRKLRGSFTLVRTRMAGGKPQWLLIKHQDEFADPDYDPVADEAHSAKSDRTMAEIEKGGKVWHSNAKKRHPPVSISRSTATATSNALKPMLISGNAELLEGPNWIYEQKLDGVRLIAYVSADAWTVISRNGNDKSQQFPELGPPLLKLAKLNKGPLILDGEVVAIDKRGRPIGFEHMQGRIHLSDDEAIESEVKNSALRFYIFDILLEGGDSLLEEEWRTRRKHLAALLKKQRSPLLVLSEASPSAEAMAKKAAQGGWEGLIGKDIRSPYLPGVRTKAWFKWKLQKREELVVGGWTEPKGSRKAIGSLLLGSYNDDGDFVFAGHVGSGYSQKVLHDLHETLSELEQDESPFIEEPKTNDVAHWVEPKMIVEVKFHEWTKGGLLRQGTFLGVRDDKKAREVVHPELQKAEEPILPAADSGEDEDHLDTPQGRLKITHPNKVMFPADKITKADLFAYYKSMAPFILPWMKDRPLVLRRFPGGIKAKDFYQQAPDPGSPGRIETIVTEDGAHQDRLIGGDLLTLLYTIQMNCISYDPWHSRVGSLDYADYSIIDLDPSKGTPFSVVREIAILCMDLLKRKGLHGAIKTSGATGIHIYLPMPRETPVETARLVAEILCTELEALHPAGTMERSVQRRSKGSVYLDSQQNFLSKSVAGVWAVRARDGATVSTPISVKELKDDIEPTDFTIRNVPKEAKKRQKYWDEIMAEPISLEALMPKRSAKKTGKTR